MIRRLWLLVLCTLPAFTAAQGLEFKGLKLGTSTATDLSVKFPGVRHYNDSAAVTWDPYVDALCRDSDNRAKCIETAIDNFGIATVPASEYAFALLDGFVEAIQTDFIIEGYGIVSRALRAKYGNPTKTDKQPVKNRAGSSFDNEELTWVTSDGVIEVAKRGAKIDTSRITYRSKKYNAHLLDKLDKAAKQATKDGL